MEIGLPAFVVNEVEIYVGYEKSEFSERISKIIDSSNKEETVRTSLEHYLSNKSDLEDNTDQMIVLTYFLLSYWCKEYDSVIDYFNKFNETIDKRNLSLLVLHSLSLRNMFSFEEFKKFNIEVEKLVDEFEDSREKDFLRLSLKEFSAETEKRPELGYKALNEILRYLLKMDDLSKQFPFILDALLSDLVNFAYVIVDDTLKDLWIESAVKRAESFNNDGMLCSLYDLLTNISMKEYDMKKAEEYIEKGVSIAKKLNSDRLLVNMQLNIATKEKMNGKLNGALVIYKDMLKIENLLIPTKIQVLEKIGEIYLLNEESEKAEEYYETAHNLNQENGFIYALLEIAYGYLKLLHRKDDGEALKFGMQLAEEQFDFNAMSYFYFYKGLYFQKKVNLSDAVEQFERALEFFENQVILEGIVYSYGELAESYFEMFRITENNVFAEQFLYYIDNLLNVTQELEHPLFIDAMIIKACYFQYRDLDKRAREILQIALAFAEQNELEEKIEELKIRLRDKPSLLQELKGSKRLFNRIRKFSFGAHKKIPIILYLLLVIDEGGLPLYSYNFSETEGMDDILVSGLITAIINFSSEVLGKGIDTLRSINHEGRAVIIEQQENIMAVLVADNETFEGRLQVRKFLKEAVTKIKENISIKVINQEEFQPIVHEVFSDSPFTLK
ncbi:MAG: tetratricopeptide repeat protein [Candidatus Heimdallarchaeaceae archaeon]